MVKLVNAKRVLSEVRSRVVAPKRGYNGSYDRKRDATHPWRRWYRTARWRALRSKIIRRDRGVCQQTGVLLIGFHPAGNSPVVDHIVPHRGDADLFWDETNLQTVSKAYHDSEKQKIERGGSIG